MDITQLGYIGLGVSDLPAWERFATEFVGTPISERGADGTLYLRMDEYHHRIALVPSGEDDLLYAGWMVPNPAALECVAKRLCEAGLAVEESTPEQARQRHVRRFIAATDTSGLRHEVYVGGYVLPRSPFQASRPMVSFKADDYGLGHVVLRVPDQKAAEAFYTNLLGLRLTDYGSGRIAFLHCNRRHHSVAVGEVPGGPKCLIHLMLEVNTLDELGTAYDVAEQRGVPLLKTIGKHPNDHMVSFYVETPSGFELEYGFGAREVDDATWVLQSYERGDVWGHKPIARGAAD
ncbi:MAG: VOC family protein [Chloroflexi bacterium]|nr:VOC family protein [Chloroflexota bacterium]